MIWQNLTANYVRTASLDGRRLALDFALDFKNKFGKEICISCASKFKDDYQKYIETMVEKKDVKYRLKKKYNGIVIGYGKRGRLTNERMNDADAKHLLLNHPKGKELFEVFPIEEKKIVKKKEKKQEKSNE